MDSNLGIDKQRVLVIPSVDKDLVCKKTPHPCRADSQGKSGEPPCSHHHYKQGVHVGQEGAP